MGKTGKGQGRGVVVQPEGVVMPITKSKGTSTSSKGTPPRAHPVQQGTASASVTINKAKPSCNQFNKAQHQFKDSQFNKAVHRVQQGFAVQQGLAVQQGTAPVQGLAGAIETMSRDMSRLQSAIEMLTASVEEQNRLTQESNSLSHTTMVMLREAQQTGERRINPEVVAEPTQLLTERQQRACRVLRRSMQVELLQGATNHQQREALLRRLSAVHRQILYSI
jgi:hypothetical protein